MFYCYTPNGRECYKNWAGLPFVVANMKWSEMFIRGTIRFKYGKISYVGSLILLQFSLDLLKFQI